MITVPLPFGRLVGGADATPSVAATDKAPAPSPGHARRRRVLVVDDNVDAADAIGEVLLMFGYEVQVVYDPSAALRVCEAFKPDVAVLDIGLPGMDGYDLAERLRQLPVTARTRLIALSGYGRDQARQGLRAGFDEHLVKPVDPDTLATLIDAYPLEGV